VSASPVPTGEPIEKTQVSTLGVAADRGKRDRFMKNSYVYFISEGLDGPVKIGHTQAVGRRLRHLQVCNSRELKFRFAVHCESPKEAKRLEVKLHKCMGTFWIRGEWFDNRCIGYAKIVVDDLSNGRKIIKSLDFQETDDETTTRIVDTVINETP